MNILTSLLACLLLHYMASPLAQTYQVNDPNGHVQFTDQYSEAHQASASITATQKEPVDYQATALYQQHRLAGQFNSVKPKMNYSDL